MKTDVIVVSSKGKQMETALAQADKVAVYKGLSPKSTLHLRLLTEEMMGMMRSITGETEGKFWIEDKDDVFSLHLLVETSMTSVKRDMLLSASTSGKNESARTLMGWIRDVFDRSADRDVAAYTSPMMMPGMIDQSAPTMVDWEWSLAEYEAELASSVQREDEKAAAWDQLEKSVVRNVADDVKISIRGQSAEMIIIKKMT